MKRFLSFILMIVISFGAFASVREAVCIVYPEYSDDIITNVNDIAAHFNSKKVSNIFTESIEPGSFGSGFIYNYKGKKFVITNQHVVAYANAVTIEIQNKMGDISKKIEHCKIIATDEELDLCIIELPKDSGLTASLAFYKKEIIDGEDIFSAGYPGLGEDPTWQLGKGNVSNSITKIEELVDPKKSYFIQHSAPIDAGNSGGPLLIRYPKDKMGYRVIGVNKSKAIFRENTNFAIPVSTIEKFIRNSFKKKNMEFKQNLLNSTCNSFINCEGLSDEIDKKTFKKLTELMFIISDEYAFIEGCEALKRLSSSAPDEIQSAALFILTNDFPVDALKFALAYNIMTSFKKYSDIKFIQNEIKEDGSAIASYKSELEGDEVSTKWIF